jgi:hypothetical protein
MRAFKLVVFGLIAALGVLRGLDLLFVARAVAPGLLPLALGILCAVLFAREWKKKA